MKDAFMGGGLRTEVIAPLMTVMTLGGGFGHDSTNDGIFLLEGHEVDGGFELLREGNALCLTTDDEVTTTGGGRNRLGLGH